MKSFDTNDNDESWECRWLNCIWAKRWGWRIWRHRSLCFCVTMNCRRLSVWRGIGLLKTWCQIEPFSLSHQPELQDKLRRAFWGESVLPSNVCERKGEKVSVCRIHYDQLVMELALLLLQLYIKVTMQTFFWNRIKPVWKQTATISFISVGFPWSHRGHVGWTVSVGVSDWGMEISQR